MGNYFEVGCSARILCCEPETAYPKPPTGAALPPVEPPTDTNICYTMVPPSILPPDDSTCWQWWTPPANGVMTENTPPAVKGCDYKPCEAAVCGCDNYCCETAWDISCRGYEAAQGDSTENNYFEPGCSAKLLCCEPESAYPDPPVGGALPGPNVDISQVTSTSTASSTSTSSATSTSTATLAPTSSPIGTSSPTIESKSSKKGSSKGTKGPKSSKKGSDCKGKGGKAGKKGSSSTGTKMPKSSSKSKGTKMPKSSKSNSSQSKGSKKARNVLTLRVHLHHQWDLLQCLQL